MSIQSHICLVSPGAFPVSSPRSSSVETVIMEMARELTSSTTVTVIGRRFTGEKGKELIDGVMVLRVKMNRRRSYRQEITELLAKLHPDVIQVENRPVLAARLKQRFPFTPIWLSLHSVTYISPHKISRHKANICLRACDLIWTNSDFLRITVGRRFPSVTSKVETNHLGVRTGQFVSRWTPEGRKLRESVKNEWGLGNNKLLLYVGRLQEIKGVHRLLAAMPRIVAKEEKVKLVIVGSAYYSSNRETAYVRKLKRLAKKVPGKVKFVPYVPHTQIGRWFSAADVVIVPSIGAEAFGLVNVEAMASGVPVVASRNGGIAEVVEDGKCGLLVSPKQMEKDLARAVLLVIQDEKLAEHFGKQGWERVRSRFLWKHTAERLRNRLERRIAEKTDKGADRV